MNFLIALHMRSANSDKVTEFLADVLPRTRNYDIEC